MLTVMAALPTLAYDEKHRDLQVRRMDGIGSWLLSMPVFIDWLNGETKTPTLWCYGGPGAGKTYLAYVSS